MPNSATEKTKSAPKHLMWWVAGAAAAVLVLGSLAAAAVNRVTTRALPPAMYTLQTPDKTYRLSAARTAAEQEQGLSDTAPLPADRGMLFLNEAVTERCFWMKDMRYALDIIWLDASKKVVHVAADVSPKSYPKTYCAAGQYILELQAGQAARSGLRPGQAVTF